MCFRFASDDMFSLKFAAFAFFAFCDSSQAADYEAELLFSAVAEAQCLMTGPAEAMLQLQFLFALGDLTAPWDGNTDTLRRHALASDIVTHAEFNFVMFSFQDGAAEGWKQEGAFNIPEEYEGRKDLNSHTYWDVVPGTKEDDCGAGFYVEGSCQALGHFYSDLFFDPIKPPFDILEEPYNPTTRPAYKDALASQGTVWSQPYLDVVFGNLVVNPSATLLDKSGILVGVAAGGVSLSKLEEFLVGEAMAGPQGTVIYIMDSSKEQNLIASSIEGLVAKSYAHDEDSDCGQSVCASVHSAQSSTNEAIAMSAASIANEDDPSQVFVSDVPDGKVFIQAAAVDEFGSIPFHNGVSWVFVVVQPAVCGAGSKLDEDEAKCVAGSSS